MNVKDVLDELRRDKRYRHRMVHVERLAAREARYAAPSAPLDQSLADVLGGWGIRQLYSHQAAAIDGVRSGDDVAVVTGTASGKTMCYNLPVLESLRGDPEGRALYLFPTKALSRDQLKTLHAWQAALPQGDQVLRPAVYDGDTPQSDRRRIRTQANVVLSNPDMMHVGILPYHGRWASFLQKLRYVVVDELHTYRGIFGSNVAMVLRRLERVCRHYGSRPQFLCASATIANPQELAERLTGRQCRLIDDDGSPRGPRSFVLWNPPETSADPLARRSANMEATELFVELVGRHVQTIVFTKARVVAELVYRYATDKLREGKHRALADRVRSYRGGYLPEERRAIERALFSGELLGVASTNALELGIDVGGLDAAVLVGFPGTIASTWQQSGRAGRGDKESLTVLVAYNDPIDQYLIRHPDYFFSRPVEQGIVDIENPYILANHLACAAVELPLGPQDAALFGSATDEVRQVLAADGRTRRIGDRDFWACTEVPSQRMNLRNISDNTFSIVDTTDGKRQLVGNVDAISAPELVYPEGIYLHEGQSYQVRELDLQGKVAYIERADTDYYTQPVLADQCTIVGQLAEKPVGDRATACFGELDVTWATVAFKKIRYYTMENIGQTALDLPSQTLSTTGVWIVPETEMLADVARMGLKPVEGLVGIRNAMLVTLPVLAMCDRKDLSGVCNSSGTGVPTMFVYDRFLGGLGFSQRGYELVGQWLDMCRALLEQCPCDYGCPSCVGLANLRPPLHQDPDLTGGYAIPDKVAAVELLSRMLMGAVS
ncbi:MAG TPA: DEAD/DEAH box helicase [Phycisphaerae bacterium]|nr:DEAD/DEAH box helicase [Phycisphaerae bacterium]HOI54129.1 DEAD/DEAH box helicase [Phycisphaerae bacterium]